jgi:hypothetical protein
VLTKGNHDNAGTESVIDADREPPGWNQLNNREHWEGLEAAYGVDRSDHVATNPNADEDGHAWVIALGGQPLLVVISPYRGLFVEALILTRR